MTACPNCGTLPELKANTCTVCGAILSDAATVFTSQPPQPVAPASSGPPRLTPPTIPIRHALPESRGGIAQVGLSAMTTTQLQHFSEQPTLTAADVRRPEDIGHAQVYCLVCGLVLPPARHAHEVCPRCSVPLGDIMDPNDITCCSVLHYSGHAASIEAAEPLPASVKRTQFSAGGWSWGAAICSTWWAFRHRCWGWAFTCLFNLLLWGLIALAIPASMHDSQADAGSSAADNIAEAIGLVILLGSVGFWFCKTIYLGLAGNTLALLRGRYTDENSMRASIRKWNIRGGLIGGTFLILLLCEIIWASMQ